MSYDAAAVRRLGVDPKSWRWFNASYDQYRVAEPDCIEAELRTVKITKIKPGFFTGFIISLVAYIFAFVFIAVSGGRDLSQVLTVPGIMVLSAMAAQTRINGLKALGIATLAITLFILFFSITTSSAVIVPAVNVGDTTTIEAISAGLQLLAALCVGRLLRISMYCDEDTPEIPAGEMIQMTKISNPSRIFGKPGGVASAANKFGQDAVDAGVRGEESTAVLLEFLMKIPGTNVFHGLRFPGSANADVDHAVVHGSMVYLIDSKQYRWGEYEWNCMDNGDEIVRSDGYGHGKANHMDVAAEGYRKILGPGVAVVPLILIHGKNVKIGKNRTSSNGVMLLTANDAMSCIGDSFYERMNQWRDNDDVRQRLLQNMK